MRRWMIRWKTGTAVCMAAALLCGCSLKMPLMSDKKGEKEYGKAETMVILTSERARYEELYSDKIWNAAVDNRGTTFESTLLLQIHDFLRELKVMSLMAEKEKLQLSGMEKDLVKQAAEQYFTALGDEQAAEFDLSQKDVEKLYSDYWSAQKLVERLTQGMNLEVSDSEAKVITVSQMEFSDMDTAQEALAKVRNESADFSFVAKSYSGDKELRKQVFRGLRGKEYEDAAYSLAAGEISSIVEDGGMYYIIKCISDYDETATQIHKEQMLREKKNQAFYGSYQAYKDETVLTEDVDMWKTLSITQSPKVEADFFRTFETVCEGAQ